MLEFDLGDQRVDGIVNLFFGVETVLSLFRAVLEEEGCLAGNVVQVLVEDEVADGVARDAEVGRGHLVEGSVGGGDALEGVTSFFRGWFVKDIVALVDAISALDFEGDDDGADDDLQGLDDRRGAGVVVEHSEVTVERGHGCCLGLTRREMLL